MGCRNRSGLAWAAAGFSLGREGATRPGGFSLDRRLELRELRSLLLRDDLLALGGAAERGYLARGQLAELARRDIEAERPIADATNLLDVVADLLEHLAQLPVAP